MLLTSELDRIVNALDHGQSILFPTDTIWGIGCDATNELAVDQIFEIKNRPKNKPFVVLVDSITMLRQYVKEVHPRIETLLHYHTRPLTVIYPHKGGIARNTVGADDTVAIRVTLDPFCQDLIRHLGRPVIATSANVSEEPFPKSFQEISNEVKEKVDLIVDYRTEMGMDNEPSCIVKLSERAELVFLRD